MSFQYIRLITKSYLDVFRSYSAPKKNGQYKTGFKKIDCCVLFTINLRYEIRQDLVMNLMNLIERKLAHLLVFFLHGEFLLFDLFQLVAEVELSGLLL